MGNIKRIIKRLHLNDFVYMLLCLFKSQKLYVDNSIEILSGYSKKPNGYALKKNNIQEKPLVDVQIIVPAYNAEKYIKQCIDSILSQETAFTFKILAINDGSSDKTQSILESYNDSRLIVINQSNRGFSGARNTGLNDIFGEYIMFADSDDYMMPGAIERLVACAKKNNADIVEGGIHRFCDNGSKRPDTIYKDSAVVGLGTLSGFAWGKVFKNTIFANLCFPENYWYEDSIFSFLVYPNLNNKYFTISDIVYAYRDNPKGITNQGKKQTKCLDTYWITEEMMEEHYALNLPVDTPYFDKVLRQLLINYKRTQLLDLDIQKAMFSASCDLIDKYFPIGVRSTNRIYEKIFRDKDFGKYYLYGKTH